MPLHSLLALESLKAKLGYLPLAVVILCSVLIAVAFFIGLAKGGARVSWGGFAWLIAALGFVFADKYLHAKNPVYTMLDARGFDARVTDFASSLTLALACALAVLLFYGIAALVYRRRRREKAPKDLTFEMSVKYGSYDGFEVDEDESGNGKKRVTAIGRIMGGLICAVNTAAVLATVVCAALLVVDSTSLKNGAMSAIYTVPAVTKLIPYVVQYALDIAIVGVIVAVALAGAKKGFTETVRLLVVRLGGLAAIVLCFYLPFSRFADSNGFLSVTVSRAVGLVSKLGVSEKTYTIGGKIISALLLCVIVVIAFVILNQLLKLLARGVSRGGFFRVLDRALACLIFLAFGVALCALVWAVLYVFSYYGVFYMGGLTRATSTLSRGFFEVFDIYLQPWLVRLSEKVAGIL